jgi:zinc D-Ala-D-Ala carboxypeptidase
MKLSEHFTLEELTESQTAARLRIDNYPSPAQLDNLRRLAGVLEQVRALVGTPIRVSSGFRSAALNVAVGGSRNSAHTLGLAADINAADMSPRELALAIKASGIEFDQLIYEGTWVHLGLSMNPPRRELLTAHFGAGKTTYTMGIA